MHDLTHASFFSGVGGLDLGLERAGWRTVSFSEIDPYASAVLAERWPGVPNLGDIGRLGAGPGRGIRSGVRADGRAPVAADGVPTDIVPWATATLWSGGFPCQDLSVAGKRAGFAGERSSLAFAFLDLVEQHRPPAILLENVPGLLSSNGGRDFGRLLGEMGDLGYWWAYRILDAQFFGVPQRRRRVFICALHAGAGFGADSPAAVLSVGSRCHGHLAAGNTPRPAASDGIAAGIARSLSTSQQRIDADTESFIVANGLRASDGHHGYSSPRGDGGDNLIVGAEADPGGVRAANGLAGRLDDHREVAPTLLAPGAEGGRRDKVPVTLAPTLRVGPARPQDGGPGDTVPIIVNALRDVAGLEPDADSLLPLGLDSHRYRCCGNGVVSNVSEWIGVRLAEAMA